MNKKDMVEDIFRNNPINGRHLYTDSLAYQRELKYRLKRRDNFIVLNRIKSIMALKLAKGILFSKILLLRIELYKELLIISLDSEHHVYI